jgi:hypothetical protein
VRHGEHIRVLAVDDIAWIRADGNYLHIHVGPVRYLHRETLRHLLLQLDPTRFLRIHRRTLVNLSRIREVHPGSTPASAEIEQVAEELARMLRFDPVRRECRRTEGPDVVGNRDASISADCNAQTRQKVSRLSSVRCWTKGMRQPKHRPRIPLTVSEQVGAKLLAFMRRGFGT